MSPERKDQLVEMLKAQLGSTYKKNSLTQYLDQLLARELEEAENPNLAQKRVLEGTMLEDLACPRKHAPGKKMDGELLLLSRIYNTLSLPLHTACNRISCSLVWCGGGCVRGSGEC